MVEPGVVVYVSNPPLQTLAINCLSWHAVNLSTALAMPQLWDGLRLAVWLAVDLAHILPHA